MTTTTTATAVATTSQPPSHVQVAVRIRPLLQRELSERCTTCITSQSSTEVLVGQDRTFTFDYVFDPTHSQEKVYNDCVLPLVENLFEGYNATVLAYGQTGSGKTYTMGSSTTNPVMANEVELGVIPRATVHLFDMIDTKRREAGSTEFYMRVQFLEVYGEHVRDLLDSTPKLVTIRDVVVSNTKTEVQVVGAVEEIVKTPQDMLSLLERGTCARTTGMTDMNDTSSRSHAIFTLILEQHIPSNTTAQDGGGGGGDGSEYRTSKFHFVDLAGSERVKRTNATGQRFKEGVNINMGLLALGNVISALGDETKKASHVPYRTSKLTRMLQDSLGGNSRTLMIACVSPADVNFEETLNALRYANRARNIQNKAVVNRDPASSQIAALKAQVASLKAQLEASSGGGGGGALPLPQEGSEVAESELETRRMLEEEITRLNESLQREKRARSELQEKLSMLMALEASELIPSSSSTLLESTDDSDPTQPTNNNNTSIPLDDEDSLELRQQFEQTQRTLRRLLLTHESTLVAKETAMQEIATERAKFEAMRNQYESQIHEMETEVRETQKERDVLSAKLRELESQHSQTDDSRAQAVKLRAQLADKDKRLKELEEMSRKYTEAKKAASEWQRKEHLVRGEIETAKREKVELTKKLSETTKKHLEELRERRLEVAGLIREKSRLEHEANMLSSRTERDERLLQQKSQQIAAMQRKLRDAQRPTTLSQRDRSVRMEMEKLATERLQREEELADLRRVLAKKEEAIARRNLLVSELERLKNVADEKAAEAAGGGKRVQLVLSASEEDVVELEQRLEVVNSEITFRDGQALAALKREKGGADVTEQHPQQEEDDVQGTIELTSLEQASEVCRVLMTMLVDAKKEIRSTRAEMTHATVLAEKRRHAALLMTAPATPEVSMMSCEDTPAPQQQQPLPPPPNTPPKSIGKTDDDAEVTLDRINVSHRRIPLTPPSMNKSSSMQDPATVQSQARIRNLEQRLKSLQVGGTVSPPPFRLRKSNSSLSRPSSVVVWERLTSPSNYTGTAKFGAIRSKHEEVQQQHEQEESVVDEMIVLTGDRDGEEEEGDDEEAEEEVQDEYVAGGGGGTSTGGTFANVMAMFAEANSPRGGGGGANGGGGGKNPLSSSDTSSMHLSGWERVAMSTTESYSKKRALDAEARRKSTQATTTTMTSFAAVPISTLAAATTVIVMEPSGTSATTTSAKENTASVHERLNDPKSFTGTQKHRLALERAARRRKNTTAATHLLTNPAGNSSSSGVSGKTVG